MTISGWNFDWDDNIFFMPTDVVLFHTSTNEEQPVSTAKFAAIRSDLGKSGPWKEFEVRPASFRFFFDDPEGRNYFREDIDRAIGANDPSWIGPSWEPFLFALERPETALVVTIITARGHSQSAMLDGLRYLHSRGYIRNLPPKENLFAVSHESLASSAATPAKAKTNVMVTLLDQMDKLPVESGAQLVTSRNGDDKAKLHLWGFSDDDWGNFDAARTALSAGVSDGRWSNVKITMFYTGLHDPSHKRQVIVIKDDGTSRPQLPIEMSEGVVTTLLPRAVPGPRARRAPDAPPLQAAAKLWDDAFAACKSCT